MYIIGAIVSAPSHCEETGGKMRVGGPIWSAPIHSQEIIDELLRRLVSAVPQENTSSDKDSITATAAAATITTSLLPYPVPTIARLTGLLTTMSEEIKDVPLHYTLPDLAATMHIPSPNLIDIQAAIVNAGYKVSQAHHEPTAIKTNAPNRYMSLLYGIF